MLQNGTFTQITAIIKCSTNTHLQYVKLEPRTRKKANKKLVLGFFFKFFLFLFLFLFFFFKLYIFKI